MLFQQPDETKLKYYQAIRISCSNIHAIPLWIQNNVSYETFSNQ
jgi:hypothetical protein